jgi:subtilisin family serine protease
MTRRFPDGRAHGIALAVVLAGTWHGPAVAGPPAALRSIDVARGLRVAGDEKLDARLRTFVAPGPALPHRPELALRPAPGVRGGAAHVFVRLEVASATDVADLARAGLKIERVNAGQRLVRGWLRTKDLRRLTALGVVRTIVPVRSGRLRIGTVTSEGDAAALGPQARATGVDGTGVTVGVISDGIDHLATSIGSLDAPVGTGVPVGPDCGAGSGDEGTAILEIVHDLAPGATLRFSEGLTDKQAFVDSVSCLVAAGAQVIVDDVGFYDEPFFEDGMVAEAVRTAVEGGVSFVSAAGNDGARHYGATFTGTTDPTSGAVYHDFASGTGGAHDTFERLDLAPGATLACVLQWNDRWGASTNDYDLELWDLDKTSPAIVAASTNVQNGSQDPLEEISGVANQGAATAHLGVRVKRVAGVNKVLGLFCFGATSMQHVVPAGSIIGHPAVDEVIAVGAIDVHQQNLNQVEDFSSQGPATIYFPTLEVRHKPDLAGFDGVATAVCPSPSACFDPFFGTSAAAPHAAAVAALLLSKEACRTPAEVQQALRAGAADILATGTDDVSGAGRLDALATLATPGPCADGDPCTADACGSLGGCTHTTVADGTACADQDLCNGTETCQSGTCTPGTPLVCDDGDPCTTDACDPKVGCISRSSCDDANPCTADTCDPSTGCQHAPVADGTACPDHDLCNGTETCQAGSCAPGEALACADGGACTTASCTARKGCAYAPIEEYTGVACLCAQGLAPSSCAGVSPPRTIDARFARACALVARASTLQSSRRAQHVVARSVRMLGAAMKVATRLSQHGRLAPDCASALGGILADAGDRARRVRDTLP